MRESDLISLGLTLHATLCPHSAARPRQKRKASKIMKFIKEASKSINSRGISGISEAKGKGEERDVFHGEAEAERLRRGQGRVRGRSGIVPVASSRSSRRRRVEPAGNLTELATRGWDRE